MTPAQQRGLDCDATGKTTNSESATRPHMGSIAAGLGGNLVEWYDFLAAYFGERDHGFRLNVISESGGR